MTEEFNKDELEAPEWMNKTFFEEVLNKSEKTDGIVVTEVQISPATSKGDHYASVMFRGKVTYNSKKAKGQTRSLIVKIMPQVEGHKKDMLKESFVFETEINMYSNTIPKLEAELRKIGDQTILGAKLLYYSFTPQKCIIFEDIVPLGYRTLNERSANLADSKVAVLKLAKWHAASYKLAAEGDSSVTDYAHGVFSLKEIEKNPMMVNGMKNFIEKCETIHELKQYVPKLRLIEKDLVSHCIESFNTYRKKDPQGVFVLCHGDFHSRNMMFKKNDKGETEDVMLVDFQVCYFGPAVLDLIYGMYMLVNSDVRENHYDELIHYYCSNFTEVLEKLKVEKSKIPKISDFFIDLLRHRRWDLFLLVTFLPMWMALEDELLDFEELFSSNELLSKLYHKENYVKEIKRLLPILFYRGYLE